MASIELLSKAATTVGGLVNAVDGAYMGLQSEAWANKGGITNAGIQQAYPLKSTLKLCGDYWRAIQLEVQDIQAARLKGAMGGSSGALDERVLGFPDEKVEAVIGAAGSVLGGRPALDVLRAYMLALQAKDNSGQGMFNGVNTLFTLTTELRGAYDPRSAMRSQPAAAQVQPEAPRKRGFFGFGRKGPEEDRRYR